MKIPMTAATAMLLCLGNSAAAQSEKYDCDVAHFQHIRPDKGHDDEFTKLNLRKKYEITVQAKSIVTTFTVDGRTFSNEYPIDTVGVVDRLGAKSTEMALDSIALALKPNPYYGNKYPASLIVQGANEVNVWQLLCSKR